VNCSAEAARDAVQQSVARAVAEVAEVVVRPGTAADIDDLWRIFADALARTSPTRRSSSTRQRGASTSGTTSSSTPSQRPELRATAACSSTLSSRRTTRRSVSTARWASPSSVESPRPSAPRTGTWWTHSSSTSSSTVPPSPSLPPSSVRHPRRTPRCLNRSRLVRRRPHRQHLSVVRHRPALGVWLDQLYRPSIHDEDTRSHSPRKSWP
jgi:hypothetical protein